MKSTVDLAGELRGIPSMPGTAQYAGIENAPMTFVDCDDNCATRSEAPPRN